MRVVWTCHVLWMRTNPFWLLGYSTPELLRVVISSYLNGSSEMLRPDVFAAIVAVDAHLLAKGRLLLEDVPLDVLDCWCREPACLTDEAHLSELRARLYGKSQFPIHHPTSQCNSGSGDCQSSLPVTQRRRQFVIEREAHLTAIKEYLAFQRQMTEKGEGGMLSQRTRVWMQWATALSDSIRNLRNTQGSIRGLGALGYRMIRDLEMDSDLLSVITCQTALNLLLAPSVRRKDDLKGFDGRVPFVTLVVAVGEAVELEQYFREVGPTSHSRGVSHNQRMRRAVYDADDAECRRHAVVLGAALVDLLLEHACVEVDRSLLSSEEINAASNECVMNFGQAGKGKRTAKAKAFGHDLQWSDGKTVGYVRLKSYARDVMELGPEELMRFLAPKYQPMVVQPRPWRPSAVPPEGGFLMHRVPFIRTTNKKMTCLEVYNAQRVAHVMDFLGQMPWKINGRILEVMLEVQRQDLAIAEVPPKLNPELPRIPENAAEFPPHEREALLLSRHNAEKRCMELVSERPTFQLKLQAACNFEHADRIYFPHNVDFRGRTYPISPHLNHISDDICRGLLSFAEPKPLGKEGFFWLKVSLANLLGKDKLPFDERVAFVDASRDWIMEVAKDPLAPQSIKHWAKADDGPWQALARCFELAEIWRTGDEEGFQSCLPVHLDGSCNGLQHYAALGRDQIGAMAVNLLPSDRPQDVYTIVLGIVKGKVQHDARTGNTEGTLARRLEELNVLQRKVVKQTIMTICYGVTTVGAKQQVQGQLESLVGDQVGPEELSILASYLSKLVLKSIDEVFERAMAIKAWFDKATQILNQLQMPTAWFSPIGLACVQPYKKVRKVECQTKRQKVTIATEDGPRVDKAKQRMGFPPNFIHSLDATHMMMTAEGCQREGIGFAGVHDSFWTHACDVPALNRIIRSAFIELHSQPILQDLYEDLHVRLGGLELLAPPAQGQLDLTEVSKSLYFFS